MKQQLKDDFGDALATLLTCFGSVFGAAMALGAAWTLYSLLWGAIAGRLPW